MRRRCLLFLVAILPFPLLADLQFDPPHPDSRSWIRATVVPTTCGVLTPRVTIDGSVIRIEAGQSGSICIAAWAPFPIAVNLGRLVPGEYAVITGGALRPATRKIWVRGVDPYRAYPAGGLTEGGFKVRFFGDEILADLQKIEVRFGGEAATDVQWSSAGTISATAPPHAPGIVDVTIATSERTYTIPAALRYHERDAPLDRDLHEPLLFPAAFEGPGAYGSRWTTENMLWIEGLLIFREPPCGSCTREPYAGIRLGNDAPAGKLLDIARGSEEKWWHASSRIRDLSRQADSAGTEIPVVRESDFRDRLVLVNVPLDPRFRATLRVWSLGGEPRTIRGVRLERQPGGFLYGSADLAAQPGPANIDLYDGIAGPGIWAMISITNNETQQVTIITPQP